MEQNKREKRCWEKAGSRGDDGIAAAITTAPPDTADGNQKCRL